MEMPEGWERLNKMYQKSKSIKTRKLLGMSIQMHYEMAGALESNAEPLQHEVNCSDWLRCQCAVEGPGRKVLKKFKEWK